MYKLDDNKIKSIAAEDRDTKQKRSDYEETISALRRSLGCCDECPIKTGLEVVRFLDLTIH